MLLQKMKWPEVKREAERGTVVIVPVGSTEQHGYHLPVDTDVACVYHIACRAAERVHAIVAPPVNYGYNEKELAFPGTVSVRAETLLHLLCDICSSLARTGFGRILLLNGHGYNTPIVQTACHVVDEQADVLCAAASYWDLIDRTVLTAVRQSKTPGGMSHAGEFETSVQLHLEAEHVDMSQAVTEMAFQETRYTFFDLLEKPPVLLRTQWKSNSESGVVGDPTMANKEKGERLVSAAVEGLADFLRIFSEEITH